MRSLSVICPPLIRREENDSAKLPRYRRISANLFYRANRLAPFPPSSDVAIRARASLNHNGENDTAAGARAVVGESEHPKADFLFSPTMQCDYTPPTCTFHRLTAGVYTTQRNTNAISGCWVNIVTRAHCLTLCQCTELRAYHIPSFVNIVAD